MGAALFEHVGGREAPRPVGVDTVGGVLGARAPGEVLGPVVCRVVVGVQDAGVAVEPAQLGRRRAMPGEGDEAVHVVIAPALARGAAVGRRRELDAQVSGAVVRRGAEDASVAGAVHR